MSKHEIRLRRQKLTARGTDRFRNYGAILERHEQEKRMKKIFRAFSYFILAVAVIVLIVIVTRIERKATKNSSPAAHIIPTPSSDKIVG
ncbi:MAG: hypothetical protein HOP08_20190 [Cyclobacteriaceae bacterium]|nr:hypothetical protein [Cyclobacteriaceae bacterium]